ncbi:2',3'-cyclic-nucleotide 2'-phosphodiesterase [Rubellimicrobium rubrum]|uniref:2',3'-cyclic-nucleotide 2'-phosphodiesterase n=1 Tax=Rubellimicrobium rubrum TaxID=2585369 RepID=A0A5C4MX96_9RHOB|nr:5'-nucleotidase C-terminal domain-containing protein [Rubellimicrobium rubrum]TNC49348.1 2',3'-cyclic-nucleotide 2'-phosphodiesterase [Rubellimicrobium rubrum]
MDDVHPVRARLRVLATTDLHVHLLPHDYYVDRPLPATGLAQAAHLVRDLRAEMPDGATLLLDNGDSLTGGLLSDLLAARLRAFSGQGGPADDGPVHPMIAAMNALGYDAATLGNHEFDHGLPFLRAALAGAAFPFVATNILLRDGPPLALPSVVIPREVQGTDGRRHALRVGLIGLAPPQVLTWNALLLGRSVEARDILDAAREEIPRLRAAGADIVLALCHSGIGPEKPAPFMENAAVPLAALPGLDALVIGHTHLDFPDPARPASAAVDPAAGTLNGKPAIQPGFYGRQVGVLDLDLVRGPGGWTVAGHEAGLRRVTPETPLDDAVAAASEAAHRTLCDFAQRPIGRTRVALHSYFSQISSDVTLDLVADAKRSEAARLLRGHPEEVLPILCAVSPYKAGGRAGPDNYIDIPPGPVALRQAASLYVHPNSLCLVEITGAGLRDWLERSMSQFRTLVPGATDQPLIDPTFPSYNFDTIDGLTWMTDLSGPARNDAKGQVIHPHAARVLDLRHGERPVADGDRFVLATNSYRVGSALPQGARLLFQTVMQMRDVVFVHLRGAPLAPPPRPRWRFAPMPGTAAWFDTGPGALARHPPTDRRVVPLDAAPDGFHRFRLSL